VDFCFFVGGISAFFKIPLNEKEDGWQAVSVDDEDDEDDEEEEDDEDEDGRMEGGLILPTGG